MNVKLLFLGLLLLLFTSQAYAALTDNLVSYYNLNEANGNALDAFSTKDLTQTENLFQRGILYE